MSELNARPSWGIDDESIRKSEWLAQFAVMAGQQVVK